MMGVAPSRTASWPSTLIEANRTSGFSNSDWEAVAKSVRREQTERTRVGGRARGGAVGGGERLQLAGVVGVDDPAAGDQQRPAGPRQQPGDLGHLPWVG